MAMYQGLDLSRFRKVASDNKVSTLRHVAGHEMKVALKGLSPTMRAAIDGMPLHLADGTPQGPVTAPAPEPAQDVMSDVMAGVPTGQPDAAAATSAAPVEPAATPNDPNTIDVVGYRPPNPAEHQEEAGKIASDIDLGHIEPKTVQSLYAKKDTLGKIGTIFGLMLSGAGSGLAHQPNALLELMQKELDRDLEAQKASKEGARNWYQMGLQHELNKAQIKRFGVENELARNQMSKTPSEIARSEAEAKYHMSMIPVNAANAAKTNSQLGVLDWLQKRAVNPMAPGPQKAAAQGKLDSLKGAAQSDITQRNLQTAADANKAAAAHGLPTSAVDYDALNKMSAAGSNGVPIPGFDMALTQAGNAEEGRELLRTYVDTTQKLNKKLGAGRLNPADREALIKPVVTRMVKHMTGSSDPHLVDEYSKTFFSDYGDVGPTRQDKVDAGIEHFRELEMRNGALHTLGLIKPFPYPTAQENPQLEMNPTGSIGGAISNVIGKSASATAKESPKENMSKSGKEMIYKDGKAYYKKSNK